MKRCGKCHNCLELDAAKRLIMPISYGPKPYHVTSADVAWWNEQVKLLPCTQPQSTD